MVSEGQQPILIIGGRGEFGQFLRQDILPRLGKNNLLTLERESPRDEYALTIQRARHIVVTTPLAGYAALACELAYQCRNLNAPATLWLVPSVQAGVWRAVIATLEMVANPHLSAVFVHPMYGPNGFKATEPEARTFKNVLTATYEGIAHPLKEEVARMCETFQNFFNITTTDAFDPEEHDRVTAYSQGLSYCVGQLMFEHPQVDALLQEHMPDLHNSFRANHDLIRDFIRINAYMPQVIAAFTDSWRQTTQSTFADVLQAFTQSDTALNRGNDSPISTKWYEKLRSASQQVSTTFTVEPV
jgi:prephenate dehydrogenase